jgi:NAD(P)-dependent dehydrogenase (short-subunit alcohol dehydrogenase family)
VKSLAVKSLPVKRLAHDLRPRGIHVVTLHPGWVKTNMGGSDADLEIPVSVRNVIALLDRVGAEHSGRFFNHDGGELPW